MSKDGKRIFSQVVVGIQAPIAADIQNYAATFCLTVPPDGSAFFIRHFLCRFGHASMQGPFAQWAGVPVDVMQRTQGADGATLQGSGQVIHIWPPGYRPVDNHLNMVFFCQFPDAAGLSIRSGHGLFQGNIYAALCAFGHHFLLAVVFCEDKGNVRLCFFQHNPVVGKPGNREGAAHMVIVPGAGVTGGCLFRHSGRQIRTAYQRISGVFGNVGGNLVDMHMGKANQDSADHTHSPSA